MTTVKRIFIALALCVSLLPCVYCGYWKYIHEPIDRAAFARGVSAGATIQRCGLDPTPALVDRLVHYVVGDMATHDCRILRAIANE